MALRRMFKIVPTKGQTINLLMTYSCKSFNNYCSTILTNNQCSKIIGKRTYITDEEITNEMVMDQNDLEEMDDHTGKILIRNLLNANSTDPLILQLNDCASVQDVFNIIREHHKEMNPIRISQSVLVLWDLQKIFYKHNIYYESDNPSNTLLSGNSILQNYMTQVNSHEDFETLIKLIEENYEKFTLEALTYNLLYLNRMGVKLKTNVMQLMIQRCEREIRNCDIDNFPLTYLSRFVVTVYSQDSLYPILVTVDSMPVILRKLDNCKTEEDFKLLTICLQKMKQLISLDILLKYKKLAEKLLQDDIVNKNNPRTIIKTIRFLNQPQWFEYNSECTIKFILLLKGSINQLTAPEVLSLFKVFQIQKEPANMLEEIQQHASNMLSKSEDNSSETTLDLLSCIVSFASPLERPKFEILIRQYLKNNFTQSSFSSLYKILYYVKSPETELCNYFWSKSLKLAQNDLNNMMNLSQKYMHFCSNIGYRYRYFNFEKSVIDYFNNELKSNIFTAIPGKFVRIASFIIAHSVDYNYVVKIMDQLVDMSYKFNSLDCLVISKGLQLLSENRNFRRYTNINNRIQSLKTSLNDCITKELQINSSLPNVNLLLRSYVMRKENIENDLFKTLLNYYITNCNELTSHIVRDTVFCLQINNCLVPDVINKIVDYIINKKESILGNTVDKVLHLCYSLGFYPDNSDDFFSTSSEIIERDKHRFSGLTFLQSCLALCYYQNLPDTLIKHIFSVHFLEKLDQELANCYAKTTYPTRVRDFLMQLNRAVCIDHPEFDVPWFHQKYVDEIMKKMPKKDFFHKEVHSILTEISNQNNKLIDEDFYTPYGYNIDFILKSKSNQNDKGTAILLLNSKAFTNYKPNLKGYYQLKKRHLEILGYNVIGLNYSEWKSFYTQENCTNYIKNKINL